MNEKTKEHFQKMILELREECSDFRDVDFLVKLCRRYAITPNLKESQIGAMLYFLADTLEHNKDKIEFKD